MSRLRDCEGRPSVDILTLTMNDLARGSNCARHPGRERVLVLCLECGKRFRTVSLMPECPMCGGSDVDMD